MLSDSKVAMTPPSSLFPTDCVRIGSVPEPSYRNLMALKMVLLPPLFSPTNMLSPLPGVTPSGPWKVIGGFCPAKPLKLMSCSFVR